mgnify:CR=1 FL=1
MSTARKPTGFLQQHYEKVAALAVLVAVVVSGGLLIMRIQSGETAGFDPAQLAAANPKPVEPYNGAAAEQVKAHLASPFSVPPNQRRLLVGELRVSSIPDGLPIPFDATVCPFTGMAQPKSIDISERDTDGDGMPDVWEELYGLNPLDPADAASDLDGDGFSNLEEFLGKSDPALATDTPPPPAKLRLVRAQVIPFKLRFLGVSRITDNEVRYQLNLRTLERTYFPRMNEEVEGYTVVAYDEKGADGPELTLQQGDKRINLIQGRVVDQQARTAALVFLVDGQRFRVNIGEGITLLGREYKVIDISDMRVVIRDEEAGKEYTVDPLSAAERDALSTGVIRSGTAL